MYIWDCSAHKETDNVHESFVGTDIFLTNLIMPNLTNFQRLSSMYVCIRRWMAAAAAHSLIRHLVSFAWCLAIEPFVFWCCRRTNKCVTRLDSSSRIICRNHAKSLWVWFDLPNPFEKNISGFKLVALRKEHTAASDFVFWIAVLCFIFQKSLIWANDLLFFLLLNIYLYIFHFERFFFKLSATSIKKRKKIFYNLIHHSCYHLRKGMFMFKNCTFNLAGAWILFTFQTVQAHVR